MNSRDVDQKTMFDALVRVHHAAVLSVFGVVQRPEVAFFYICNNILHCTIVRRGQKLKTSKALNVDSPINPTCSSAVVPRIW